MDKGLITLETIAARVDRELAEPRQRMVVEAVRSRLEQWRAYHEHRANSTPSPSYTPEDRFADALYMARKPTLSMNTPDPKLNLSISDEDILRGVVSVREGKNYHIV